MTKANYGTAQRTNGTVTRVLTRAAQHHRGFKVMLACGTVGRTTDVIHRKSGAKHAPSGGDASSTSDELSSDDFLASLDLMPPPPGQRLRDSQ